MKMTSEFLQLTAAQLNAQAVPESHPALPQLKELFGDHTFFIDSHGLNIVEPEDHARNGMVVGIVFNIATWSKDSPEHLVTHEPEQTPLEIILGRLH